LAADDSPLRLEPASPWAIDYGEESCALRRTFAVGASSADLEIMQQAPGGYFRVTVTTETFGLANSEAQVRFEPDNREQVPSYLVSRRDGARASIAFTDSLKKNMMGQPQGYLNWNDLERDQRESAIISLSIEGGFDRDLTLATGEMHVPMEALRTCMVDLYASWGVDLEALETRSTGARAQNGAAIIHNVSRLIPRAFFSSDSEMPAIVRTVVGEDGRVKRCRVHFPEWDQPLSDRLCDLVTREARYEPARDRRGHAIRSYDTILIER
jgi:hypothetical protein